MSDDEVIIWQEGGRNAVDLIAAILRDDLAGATELSDGYLRESPDDTVRALAIVASDLAVKASQERLGGDPQRLDEAVYAGALELVLDWGRVRTREPMLGAWPRR